MKMVLNQTFVLQDAGINATTWDMYDTFQLLEKETKGTSSYIYIFKKVWHVTLVSDGCL